MNLVGRSLSLMYLKVGAWREYEKALLNLINRAGLSPREDVSHWCQVQENIVAPARSVGIRFKKRAFAHAGERSN